MSEEISSMIVNIDVKSVNEASKELDNFSAKAEEAASATDDLGSSQTQAIKEFAKMAKEVDDTHKLVTKYRQNQENLEKSTIKSAEAAAKFANTSDKVYEGFRNQIEGIKNLSTASKDLSKVNSELFNEYKNKNLDIGNYRQLLADVAAKQKEVTTAESIATRAKVDFINKLKEQLTVQNMTKEQLLRYKAAQLGVSSSADVYIKKLTEAKTTTQALGKGAGVTRQQVTTMMAQLSRGDISGLKNSLMYMSGRSGGIGNAFKSIISSISPVQIGITGLIAGGVALAKAYYQGSQELSNFNKTIVMTGNYAGVTSGQVATMAKKIGSEIGTISDAANALVLALSTNKFRGQGLELVAQTAVKLQQTVGKSVNETIEEFKKLADDPVKASEELNEKYNYLTVAVYQQISALQKQGDTLGAQELAVKTYANAMDEKTNEIKQNLGTLETAWNTIASAAKSAWDAMLNIGRENSVNEKIEQARDRLNSFYQTHKGKEDKDWFKKGEGLLVGVLSDLEEQKELQEEKAKSASRLVELNNEAIKGEKLIAGWVEKGKTATEKRTEATKKLQAAIESNKKAYEEDLKKPINERTGVKLYTSEYLAKAQKEIDREFADKKSSGGHSTTNLLNASKQQEISLQNQLKALREQNTTVTTITSERKKYFDLQAQIQTLENSGNKSKLSAQEKYVLANKESLLTQYAKNAAIADEVSQYQTATKALRKMQEYSIKVASEAKAKQMTFGMTSKNEKRYNQLSELDAQREIALKGTSNPTEIAKVTEEYTKAKQALQQSWQQEDINQGDWVTGLKLGLEQYAESAQNVFGAATNFAQQSMNSLSSMMTTLVTTGKASFKDFAKSILTNLIEIINKLIIAQTIQTTLGWISKSSVPSVTVVGAQQAYTGGYISGYASGGSVGYSDRPGGFTGIGDKYMPAGVVHKGEFVFTKEATQRLGVGNLYGLMEKAERGYANGGYVDGGFVTPAAFNNGGSNSTAVNVTANVTVNMPSDDSQSSNSSNSNLQAATGQLEAMVEEKINKVLSKAVSAGGDMYNVIRAMR